MNRSHLLIRAVVTSLSCVAYVLVAGNIQAAETTQPNFLWISCEDIGPHLTCYDTNGARTPNLDRLAAEGIRYTNAHTLTGVCATCRASIITGMYPSTLGNQFMRCRVDLPDHVQLFPQYLRDAGYYCTNNSKTDYNITGNHGRCWDQSSRNAHFRNRPDQDQPFFAVFNFTNTHESRVFNYRRPENLSDDELHDPANSSVPPYHPDSPVARTDWAHYKDNISSMDRRAGQLLQELREAGLQDDTIVFFWGDHGAGLPRCKRWIYESGTHVPLIVFVPQKFQEQLHVTPGETSDELISLMDLGPTLMHLAGLQRPDHLHGQAFLGQDRDEPRKLLFTIRDRMDERYDMMRAVRDDRFKYIRNYQPYRPWFQIINYMEQEHTMKEMRRLHALGELRPTAAQFMADSKPLEELYDLKNDPHEVQNLLEQSQLSSDAQHAVEELREALRDWIYRTADTGLIPEAELQRRGESLGTRFAILQQPGSDELLTQLIVVNRWACDHPGRHLKQLLTASDDSDPAVRYWAVTGLGNAGQFSEAVTERIGDALKDSNDVVRVAAARAIWQAGQTDLALPILRETATSQQEFLSLLAMHVIDEMGDEAKPLADAVVWVKQNGKSYPSRIADYLLREDQNFSGSKQ